MAATYPIQVIISAQDAASPVVKSAASKISAALGGAARSASGAVGSITKSLVTGIGQGVGQAIARSIGSAVTGAIGAAKSLAEEFVSTGDELATFAVQVGIGVEALQAWRSAAERSDVPVERFNDGLKMFSKNLGMAHAGTGKLASGLKRVSPELLKQLKGTKNIEEALGLYIAAMERVEDPSKRAALAAMAFGSAGEDVQLMAAAGSEALRRYREEKIKDGVVSTEAANRAGQLDDQLIRLKQQWTALKLVVGEALAKTLAPLLTKLGEWYKANEALIQLRLEATIQKIGEYLAAIDWDKVANAAGEVWDAFGKVADAVSWAIEQVGGLKNALLILGGTMVLGKLAGIVSMLGGIASAASSAVAPLAAAFALAKGFEAVTEALSPQDTAAGVSPEGKPLFTRRAGGVAGAFEAIGAKAAEAAGPLDQRTLAQMYASASTDAARASTFGRLVDAGAPNAQVAALTQALIARDQTPFYDPNRAAVDKQVSEIVVKFDGLPAGVTATAAPGTNTTAKVGTRRVGIAP